MTCKVLNYVWMVVTARVKYAQELPCLQLQRSVCVNDIHNDDGQSEIESPSSTQKALDPPQ